MRFVQRHSVRLSDNSRWRSKQEAFETALRICNESDRYVSTRSRYLPKHPQNKAIHCDLPTQAASLFLALKPHAFHCDSARLTDSNKLNATRTPSIFLMCPSQS